MSTETHAPLDRDGWPAGPWDGEPDRLEFRHGDFPCLIVRVPQLGHLCGYVAVPPGHPLHGVEYSDDTPVLAEALERAKNRELGAAPSFSLMFGALCGEVSARADMVFDVHGGLTFSSKCQGRICHVPQPGEPDDVWWFGFDCAHSGDYQPGMYATWMRSKSPRYASLNGERGDHYRTVDYVREQCTKLADQLAEIRHAE